MWVIVLMLLAAPSPTVATAQEQARIAELLKVVTPGERAADAGEFEARAALRPLEHGLYDRYVAAVDEAAGVETDAARRRTLYDLKTLANALRGRGPDLAELTYALDLVGEDVSPLERALMLLACQRAGARVEVFAQCFADVAKVDVDAAVAETRAAAADPALADLFAFRLPTRLEAAKARFDALAASLSPAARAVAHDAALAGRAAWERDVREPNAEVYAATRDFEEALLFGAPTEAFAGCEARLAPLLPAWLDAAKIGGLGDVIADEPDGPGSILLTGLALCVDATGRGYAQLVYAKALWERDRAFEVGRPRPGWEDHIVRGPRAAGVRAALRADQERVARSEGAERRAERVMGRLALLDRKSHLAPLYHAMKRWKTGSEQKLEGVVAALRTKDGRTRVTFARAKVPDTRYTCWGSGRITGVHVVGDGLGVSRDVQCGYEVVGAVDVTPEPVTVPAARVAALKKGDRVTLILPGATADRDYEDAMVLEALRGPAKGEKVVMLMGVAR